ncbi:DUF962 domain-containing protein, partial [Bacteriovoracaceae bacterium]|nr:DUF962 domain-containing protein [Bacteriovoracaceae bacterium]
SEHSNKTCRRFHFIGTLLVIITFIFTVYNQNWIQLWLLPLFGYGFAWIGHFVFEKNKPAAFRQPFYSLMGDFKMFFEILIRKKAF